MISNPYAPLAEFTPDALDDHLIGAGLRADLGLDLVAVVRGDLAAPAVGPVVLVDLAGGGVGHGDDQPIDWHQRWHKAAIPTA